MADFLTNLLARNRGETTSIGPRPAIRFESPANVPLPDEPVEEGPVDTTQSSRYRQHPVPSKPLPTPSPLPSATALPTPPETISPASPPIRRADPSVAPIEPETRATVVAAPTFFTEPRPNETIVPPTSSVESAPSSTEATPPLLDPSTLTFITGASYPLPEPPPPITEPFGFRQNGPTQIDRHLPATDRSANQSPIPIIQSPEPTRSVAPAISPPPTPLLSSVPSTEGRSPVEREPTAEATPTINVTIGRIEVRANQTTRPANQPKPKPKSPVMTLEAYLKQRSEGGP